MNDNDINDEQELLDPVEQVQEQQHHEEDEGEPSTKRRKLVSKMKKSA